MIKTQKMLIPSTNKIMFNLLLLLILILINGLIQNKKLESFIMEIASSEKNVTIDTKTRRIYIND